ncbi:chemotaxis regulator - transmits chemoreceptor signals to flagelllar motor components CheY [Geminocystis sp. NIES-3708]|uniref:hybrid sensor histidine kinase/response regulator n=1 Tax=Geminocystis sp. NIES-3708 TaxID=1615909 RepID=UPI0005FC60D8|nr:response regulator [Geminocystis sp. NIES-3708]BAQ60781.1 chemotaxis regulator - transmits chemoreceptor signals to flagelllar motor components CheY [Geminocystis sp. NIES-3708]
MTQKISILVIDDDPNNFDIIEGLLYDYRYDLHYSSSGKNALCQLEIIKPDLIILDVMMPDLDGIEICKIIKANSLWQSIPIIMVTALNEKKDLAKCLEAGADDFISKPVNRAELSARVHSMLRIKKQYDSLQELLNLREEMTSIIVHDLRNPLTNIILCAGILKIPQISPEIYLEKVDEIVSSGEILNNQIDNLLQMGKLQYGQLILSLKEKNINQLLKSEINTFKNAANFCNIQLILNLPSQEKTVIIDSQIIGRIINNLLANAIKFSPNDSKIICELNYLENNIIQIKIIDFGNNISEDKKQLIFEKYQIASEMEEVQQLGLGLAFCKMAIEAHNGTIRVENNAEKGNIFIVEFSDYSQKLEQN